MAQKSQRQRALTGWVLQDGLSGDERAHRRVLDGRLHIEPIAVLCQHGDGCARRERERPSTEGVICQWVVRQRGGFLYRGGKAVFKAELWFAREPASTQPTGPNCSAVPCATIAQQSY